MISIDAPRFIVDHNVGRLTRWLRVMGYDTHFFNGDSDSRMIAAALAEGTSTESPGLEFSGKSTTVGYTLYYRH